MPTSLAPLFRDALVLKVPCRVTDDHDAFIYTRDEKAQRAGRHCRAYEHHEVTPNEPSEMHRMREAVLRALAGLFHELRHTQ